MVRKNYKKFVATAATATLVASAIAPVASADVNTAAFTDVPASYKDAVDFLVSNNIATGKSETQFDIHGNITRGDFAAILARAAGLIDGDAPSAGFTDVPDSRALIVSSLKDAGVINGISDTQFGYAQNIKRGDAAKMITKAFDLDTSDEESKFTDVSAGYEEAVNALVKAGVTNGKTSTQFGVHDNIKRGDFAKWIHALEDYVVDQEKPEVTDGITSVKAINDTRYEVTFGKAFDKDVAYEIEKEPNRIIAFDGSQNENSDDVLVANTVTFDADNKVATITLNEAPTTDINYTVALMDNEENSAAKIVAKSTPQVLVKGAETPSVDVNSAQDKVVIDFKQKMDKTALNIANYELYDDKGNSLGALSDFAEVEEGEEDRNWVDATTKKAVEFKLLPNTKELEAGKTYKIQVKEAVLTDDGDKLAENKRNVDFKTPSVNEARPAATFATVKGDTIEINFDKELEDETANLARLVKVKTATGQELKVEDDGIDVEGKKMTIAVDGELDKHSSYTVSLPENVVANAYFYNALNKAVDIKAEAQDDVAVKSMKAAFERDAKNSKQANLVLSFDQIVTNELGDFEIRVDGKTYTLSDSAEIEYGKNGKELVIKDVADSFNGVDELSLEDGKSYEIVAKAGSITTDSVNEPTNKEEIKVTVSSSVDVTAPKVDRMELVSADEIVLTFDKNINSSVDASDVSAMLYTVDRNGGLDEEDATDLGDENYIKVSVSGKKLTLKTADKDVKFVTGDDQEVTIEQDAFKSSNGIENNEMTVSKDSDTNVTKDFQFVDNAAPEIIGATHTEGNTITLTYSEALKDTDADAEDIASQFSFEGTEIKNYGTTEATVSGNTVEIEFTPSVENKNVFDAKSYPNLKIKYTAKTGNEIIDENDNKAKGQTKTGSALAN